MKFKLSINFLISAFLTLVLVSCGSSSGDKDKNSDEFKEAEESLKQQIEEVVYNIPSPSEIPCVRFGYDMNENCLLYFTSSLISSSALL